MCAGSPARPADPRASSTSRSAPASGSPSGSTTDAPGSRASTSRLNGAATSSPASNTLPAYETSTSSPGSNSRPAAAHALIASSRAASARIVRAYSSPRLGGASPRRPRTTPPRAWAPARSRSARAAAPSRRSAPAPPPAARREPGAAVVLAQRRVEPGAPDREPAAGVAQERSPAVHLREARAAPREARGARARGDHDPVTRGRWRRAAPSARRRRSRATPRPRVCRNVSAIQPRSSSPTASKPESPIAAARRRVRGSGPSSATAASSRSLTASRPAARSRPGSRRARRLSAGRARQSTSAALIVVCPASTASAAFVTRVRPSGRPPCTWPCRCPPSSGSPP